MSDFGDFGDFEGFDTTDESGDTFSNSSFDTSNFDESSSNNSDFGETGSDDLDFGNSNFDSNNNEFSDNPNEKQELKKSAIIGICVGLVGIVIVLVIASKIARSSNKNQDVVADNVVKVEQENKNVDNIMNNEPKTTDNNTNVVTNVADNDFNWTVITDSENVSFTDNYSEMVFTVTGIKHYARAVDTNNNLVIKTTLNGSISGLPGTYSIDVPYSKGVKLVVGNSFKVEVQLGTYNDKTVVGEIKY